jgi:hypothetical protein
LKLAPYTWKCKILQITWRLEISLFLQNFIFPKFRVHLDLHIYHWNFLFHEQVKSQINSQELLAPRAVKVYCPYRLQKKKNFSFYFKCYNLAIRVVSLFETFCTCSPNSLVQDPTVKIPKIEFFFHFCLLSQKWPI